MACARMNPASRKEEYSSLLSSTIEFHDDCGCARPIFQPFIAHPGVRRRNRKPKECFRDEETEHTPDSNMRNHFNLVAVKLAGRCPDSFLSSHLKCDTVYL